MLHSVMSSTHQSVCGNQIPDIKPSWKRCRSYDRPVTCTATTPDGVVPCTVCVHRIADIRVYCSSGLSCVSEQIRPSSPKRDFFSRATLRLQQLLVPG